jgi:hypothetical protein
MAAHAQATGQTHPLDLLFERACTMADRVDAGGIPFVDAIDFMWTSCEFSGLVDVYGPDQIQAVLARAFMHVRRSGAA